MSVRNAKGSKAFVGTSASGPWTEIPEVRIWRFGPRKTNRSYASSSTGGNRKMLSGNAEGAGTIDVYTDATNRFDSDLLIVEGAGAEDDPTTPVLYFRLMEDAGNVHIVQVYVDGIDYGAEVEDNNLLAATINFTQNGTYTRP